MKSQQIIMVGRYVLGHGVFDDLTEIVGERVNGANDRVVYLIDHYFRGREICDRLAARETDGLIFVDSTDEPTTEQIDVLTEEARGETGTPPVAIVGIGGGSTLDAAKAVSNLLTNSGRAADYQGWDLLAKPGVYKIGVPTLSGTGAEASRTCVMMNHAKNLKLGMNSAHSVFDRLVLDPSLAETVPRGQYFHSGMDAYIHCIESLGGRYRHAMADALSDQALALCRVVFLSNDMQDAENRERLMVASYLGGSAIGNSFVGVVHPLSAGLSMVLGLHHCIANCIVMNAMDEFYPRQTDEFRRMTEAQGIELPKGLCADLSQDQHDKLYEAAIVHEKPLANALGDDFLRILTRDKVADVFRRM